MASHTGSVPPGDKGTPQTGHSLLADVSLPAAVICESPLAHNLAWMQRFAEAPGAKLAPHGKTTMTPALFTRQLDVGAWGITLATAPHRTAVSGGVFPWREAPAAGQPVGR